MALTQCCRMFTGCIVPTFCCTCHGQGSPREPRALVTSRERSSKVLRTKKNGRSFQKLTQIGGVQRYKDELRQALAGI